MSNSIRSMIRYRTTIGLLLIFAPLVAGKEKAKTLQCVSIEIVLSLKAGESFQQQIGDLTFDMSPNSLSEKPNGWTYAVNDSRGNDLIAPVNMPLRFNPSQILGPGYGLAADESLKMSREVPFLLSGSDYALVVPLWRGALWPYDEPDPEGAAEKFTGTIAGLTLGLLELKTVKADISPEGTIRSASFKIRFVLPVSFQLDPDLKTQPSACPERHK